MKKNLIIGVILIIITISIIVYSEFFVKITNMHDITNSGSKEENRKVFLDVTYLAGTITDNYYVFFGDGVQYIVYINNDKANEINKYLLDNPDDSYRIEGITKLIPSTLEDNGKKFVNTWLDNTHNHEYNEKETHNITTDDFYHYFGYVYLDNTSNSDLVKIVISITGIMGVLFILKYISNKYHFI